MIRCIAYQAEAAEHRGERYTVEYQRDECGRDLRDTADGGYHATLCPITET